MQATSTELQTTNGHDGFVHRTPNNQKISGSNICGASLYHFEFGKTCASGKRQSESTLQVPDEALKYILYQRTDCQKFAFEWPLVPIDKLLRGRLYKLAIALQATLQPESIRKQYSEMIEQGYHSLKPYLPSEAREIVDIGCGVAGMDVHLYNHYEGKPELYLVDKTQVENRIYYGFNPRAAYYNSLSTAKTLLIQNGVDESHIHLIEAGSRDLATLRNVDLCISLLSWGFHYPVSTYLETVKTFLRKDGALIIDVKKGTSGDKELNHAFNTKAKTIMQTPNRDRLLIHPA